MKQVATKQVSPQGVVSYTTGAVVQDAGDQFTAKKTIFKTHQIVWYLLGIIEILLMFRVILRLLGANPASGFTQLIYGLSAPFVAPFWGVFGTPAVGSSAIEWSTMVAMLVYYVAALGIVKLLQILKPVTPTEVEQQVD